MWTPAASTWSNRSYWPALITRAPSRLSLFARSQVLISRETLYSSDAAILSLMNDTDTRDGGLSLHFHNGRLQLNMGPRWLDDAIRVETTGRFEPGQWLHVAVTYDNSRTAAGIHVFVNGEPAPLRVGVDLLTGGLTTPTLLRIGSRSDVVLDAGTGGLGLVLSHSSYSLPSHRS